MGELAKAILGALIAQEPALEKWIRDRIGDDDADPITRHVRDILPERSASQEVADKLREQQG